VAAAGTVVASSAPSAAAAVVNPVTPTAQPAPVLMPSDKLSPGANTAGAPVVVTAPVAQTRAALPAPAASLPAAPPASPPPTQTLPTSTQPDGVYLQLGAFGARDGADEFRTKIYQQLGWLNDTVYIVARDRLFRVQVGPYKDRAAAAAVAEKIRESLQFTPMFVLK
jgi:rare lipoprotein A